jgi:hypothetical protein
MINIPAGAPVLLATRRIDFSQKRTRVHRLSKRLDAVYSADAAIKVILDNNSTHAPNDCPSAGGVDLATNGWNLVVRIWIAAVAWGRSRRYPRHLPRAADFMGGYK